MARNRRPLRQGRVRPHGPLHRVAAGSRRQRRLHGPAGIAQHQAGSCCQ